MKIKEFKKLYLIFVLPFASYSMGYFISQSILEKDYSILVKGIIFVIFGMLISFLISLMELAKKSKDEVDEVNE